MVSLQAATDGSVHASKAVPSSQLEDTRAGAGGGFKGIDGEVFQRGATGMWGRTFFPTLEARVSRAFT